MKAFPNIAQSCAIISDLFNRHTESKQMTDYVRTDRAADELRPLTFTPNFLPHADGSVLIECGNTNVICTSTLEDNVPPFLRGKGQGWVTAEYGMLPASTASRMRREAAAGKQSGRTQEIQRLIGRSLRAVVDMSLLGERQILIDCDVIQADGGTRTASISGAFVALSIAVQKLLEKGVLITDPLKDTVAAISAGMVGGVALLDLDYPEDSGCDSDVNMVMTGSGKLIEIQGTAEGEPFSMEELQQLLALGQKGIAEITALQKAAFRSVFPNL